MKFIQTEQVLDVPEGVTLEIKARTIKVTGPRVVLVKDLNHIDVTFRKVNYKQIKIIFHQGD